MIKKLILLIGVVWSLSVSLISVAATSPLPSRLIALNSVQGDQIFKRSYSAGYFWPLDLHFVTQENLAYCSVASSVMVLNALDIPAPTNASYGSYKIFTQDDFFIPEVEKVLPSSIVKREGATLDQISSALGKYPVSIKIIHANEITVDQFRTLAENLIANNKGYIIVNFLRTSLDEEGGGHMSPLAVYDKKSDRFLMLDVASYRYPPVWVKTQDLWNAMNTLDKDAKAYRGFVIVSQKEKTTVQ